MGPVLIFLAVISVFVCAFALAIAYGLTMPFWRSWQGRAVFTLSAILAIWFGLGVAIRIWPLSPAVNLLLSLLIALVIDAALITLLVSLICARRRSRRGN